MNINAQELLLINKNMKFGETKPTGQPVPTTSPVSNPETGMKALEIQANNNIAFQGGEIGVVKSLKNKMAPLALAALIAGSGVLQSCVEQTVIVDTSALTELMQEMRDYNKLMYEQQQLTNEQLAKLNAGLTELYNQVLSGQLSQEEFNTKYLALMAEVILNQETIIANQKADGKTDAEIAATLEKINTGVADINTKLASGAITMEEAIDLLYALKDSVNSIDSTLKDILSEIKGFRADMNANMEDLNLTLEDYSAFAKAWMETDAAEQKKQTALLDSMVNNQKGMAENIANIAITNNKMLELANDPTKFNALMEKLDSIQYDNVEFYEWEKEYQTQYGLDLTDLLKTWRDDQIKAQKITIEAIEMNGQKIDKLNDIISNKFEDANTKLKFISEFLPNLKNNSDLTAQFGALLNAIEVNTQAIDKNSMITEAGINAIDGKLMDITSLLKDIIGKMDTLIDNTSGLADHFDAQNRFWEKAISMYGDGLGHLEEIKANQKVTNGTLANIEKSNSEIKDAIGTSNSYLYILTQDTKDIKEAMKNIGPDADGMTVQQFIDASMRLDSIQAENTANQIAEKLNPILEKIYGSTSSVDKNTLKLVDLVASLDNRVANQKDYTPLMERIADTGDKVLEFLKNADFTNPDYTAQLGEIIALEKEIKEALATLDPSSPDYTAQLDKLQQTVENLELKCDCNHTNDNNDDESVNGSTDLENKFNANKRR